MTPEAHAAELSGVWAERPGMRVAVLDHAFKGNRYRFAFRRSDPGAGEPRTQAAMRSYRIEAGKLAETLIPLSPVNAAHHPGTDDLLSLKPHPPFVSIPHHPRTGSQITPAGPRGRTATLTLHAQLLRFGGNISRTAQFVGMERSALHRKLKQHGVSAEDR